MADGFGNDIFRSRILGSGMEDTQYPQQQISGMMGGMQPQQMMAFLQSPQVQQQFQQFGIDPMAMLHGIRQSPFLPNSFMQGHPHLGGALSGAMANVAATPEAPMVSGAGSGMTRAMQGMMGGPELQRQYQMRQMMAPMGALGSMMPMYGEQRRRGIEEAIINQEKNRPGEIEAQNALRMQIAELQHQAQMSKGEPRFNPITGETWTNQGEGTPAQPPNPNMPPGITPMPAQPGGWQKQQAPIQRIQDVTNAKEPTTKKGLDVAKTGEAQARAALGLAEAANVRQQKGRGGTGISGGQKADQNKEMALQNAEDQAVKLVTGIMSDPNDQDEKSRQSKVQAVKGWLEGRKADVERNYGSQIGHAGGTPNSGLVSPGAGPQQGPPPKKGSGKNQPPPKQGGPQQLQRDEAGHVWDTSTNPPKLVQQAPAQATPPPAPPPQQ